MSIWGEAPTTPFDFAAFYERMKQAAVAERARAARPHRILLDRETYERCQVGFGDVDRDGNPVLR